MSFATELVIINELDGKNCSCIENSLSFLSSTVSDIVLGRSSIKSPRNDRDSSGHCLLLSASYPHFSFRIQLFYSCDKNVIQSASYNPSLQHLTLLSLLSVHVTKRNLTATRKEPFREMQNFAKSPGVKMRIREIDRERGYDMAWLEYLAYERGKRERENRNVSCKQTSLKFLGEKEIDGRTRNQG